LRFIVPLLRLALRPLTAFLLFCFFWPGLLSAETPGGDAQQGVEIQVELAEGLPISQVYVHLTASTGDPDQDDTLKSEVAAAFAVREGAHFRRVLAEFGVKRVQQLDSVQKVELRLYKTVSSGSEVALALLVSPMGGSKNTPKRKGNIGYQRYRGVPDDL
jgi:hypothetical protein